MFISISYGYILSNFYNINCSIYPLMDTIVTTTIKESIVFLSKKEKDFNKIIKENEKIFEENNQQLIIKKEENNKTNTENDTKNNIKSNNSKDKKIGELDQEILNLEKVNAEILKNNETYKNKISKIIETKEFYNSLKDKNIKEFDLIDEESVRKYLNTKLDQEANMILTDKKNYFVLIITENNSTDNVDPKQKNNKKENIENYKVLKFDPTYVLTIEEENNLVKVIENAKPNKKR